MQVCRRVAPREVVAAAYLQIGLLDEGWPDEPGIASVNNIEGAIGRGSRQTVVDDDPTPSAIEIHAKYILAVLGNGGSYGIVVKRVYK
jgi:hypothetical protein